MKRIGIAPNWKSVQSIMKNERQNITERVGYVSALAEEALLRKYVEHEPIFVSDFDSSGPDRLLDKHWTYIESAVSITGRHHTSVAEIVLLDSKTFPRWQTSFILGQNRRYAAVCMELQPSPLKASFEGTLSCLCRCLYLGWHKRAEQLTHLIADAYRRNHFIGVEETRGESIYNWFLRVAFAHYGIAFIDWAKDAYLLAEEPDQGNRIPKNGDQIEPVLNLTFDIWDKPDLSQDTDLLLNFCDYYTHRCKVKREYEFSNNWVEMRFPFAILAWFKIRQVRGLSVPQIDHPLMQTNPQAHFVPEQPYPPDEILDKVIVRLKQEELPTMELV